MSKTAIVTGAGGFIGFHLTAYLKERGYTVIGIDIKHPEFGVSAADTFVIADLRNPIAVEQSINQADELYMLAADMGGIGYIESVHAKIMHDNVLINTNCLERAHQVGIGKVFYASSACIYPTYRQETPTLQGLKESEAFPANPDNMYGWEKLFSEQLCLSYAQDYGLQVRIARFHNIYGPYGTYQGGREKSPAAICRKVAVAHSDDVIEVWGDGQQTRSYCYVDDCCEGIYRLMQSDFAQPLNIGSTELVTINELVELVASIAGKRIRKQYDLTKPQGVRGRNSDNTLIQEVLGWQPQTSLREGLTTTYRWIADQVKKDVTQSGDRPRTRAHAKVTKKTGTSTK